MRTALLHPAPRLTAFVAATLLAVLLAPAAAAQISVTVDGNGVLNVSGTPGDDSIVVACAGGNVKVNGQDPQTGPFPCDDVTRVQVLADAGNDTIDLSGLTAAAFQGLQGEAPILADGGAGDDEIAGSPLRDVLVGGPGNDVLDAGAGDDEFNWIFGSGIDTVDGGSGTNTQEVVGFAGSDGFHLFPGYFGTPGRLDVVQFAPVCCFGPSLTGVQHVVVITDVGDDEVHAENTFSTTPFFLSAAIDFGLGNDTFVLNGTEGEDDVSVREDADTTAVTLQDLIRMSLQDAEFIFTTLSGGDDVFRTQGLLFVSQDLDGAAPPERAAGGGDALIVDDEGLPFTDDGSTIQIEGRQPISYAGFESVVFEPWTTAVEEVPEAVDLRLGAPYPNPFASSTAFTLHVDRPQRVRVALYDVLGREVAVLHDGLLPAGGQAFVVEGAGLPSGVYVVRALGEAFSEARGVVAAR